MKDIFALIASVTSIVALVFVLRDFFRGRAIGRDPAACAAIVVVVLGGLLYEARMIPSGPGTQLIIFALLAGCLIVAVTHGKKPESISKSRFPMSVFLPALIAATLFLTNALMNPGLPLVQSLGRFLAVAIVILLALIFLSGGVALEDVCHIVIASVLFIVAVSPALGEGWRSCDIFKCGPFDAIYTGPFPSENAFAMYASVAIVSIFQVRRKSTALTCIPPLTLVLFATESRTSQLALGAALAAALVLSFWRSLAASERFSRTRQEGKLSAAQSFLFITVQVVIVGIGFYLILSAKPSSFSNRGNIWLQGVAALGNGWVTGLGLDRWSFLQAIGLLPPLFPHSQYLLLLFGGGVIAVGLLSLTMIISIIKARNVTGSGKFAVAYTAFLAVLGLTEAYWNPVTFDGHTMLIVPLILLLSRPTRLEPRSARRNGAVLSQQRRPLDPSIKWAATGRGGYGS